MKNPQGAGLRWRPLRSRGARRKCPWGTPTEASDTDEPSDTAEPEKAGDLGDVNGDGTVDSADALMILRYSVGLEEFDDILKRLADLNGDGVADSADTLELLRCSVGLAANENIGKPVYKPAI